ncbi:MAG: fatty acid desaturase CarF family protein [Pseudomonadota bacterium]
MSAVFCASACAMAMAVVAADLVSGLVHWAEDAYVRFKPNRRVPLLNQIAHDNMLHHRRPREFLQRSWWASSWDLVLLGALVILGAWALNVLNTAVLLFVVLACNANQLHKWAHCNPRENPRLVTWLQRLKVLQTPRHHGRHHAGERNSHYCVVTNVLNPVLERLSFWTFLETVLAGVFGLRRQPEPGK